MRKRFNNLSIIPLLLLSLSLLCISVFAVPGQAEVRVPIVIHVSGVPAEAYHFRLTPVDNAPMPVKGQEFCEITCLAEETVHFPAISFQAAGIYHYNVSQISGKQSDIIYDERVYEIAVTVLNSQDYTALNAFVAIRTGGEKTDAVTFVNRSPVQPKYRTVQVRKVWSDSSQHHPETVTVQLISENGIAATAVLSEENHWSYTWDGLIEAGKTWKVRENPVPKNYRVSYRYEDDTAIITNSLTGGLIQTGQPNRPIWVLSGIGAGGIVCGIALQKVRRKRDHA